MPNIHDNVDDVDTICGATDPQVRPPRDGDSGAGSLYPITGWVRPPESVCTWAAGHDGLHTWAQCQEELEYAVGPWCIKPKGHPDTEPHRAEIEW